MPIDYWGDAPPPLPYFKSLVSDIVVPSGTNGPLAQRRMEITYQACVGPTEVTKRNLLYTPSGFAWDGWVLDGESSITLPRSLRQVVRAWDRREPKVISRGTVVQSEHRTTYGDWVPCFLKPLALAQDIPQPLLLPANMKGRGYVEADLARLGIEAHFCEHPVLVKECHVLKRRTTRHVWEPEELAEVRMSMNINPPSPKPGSIIYLSRIGVKSNLALTPTRNTNSALVEGLVSSLGGAVVRTEGMGFDDFAKIADQADTVIADHGAAMCNLVQWRPRHVIELVPEDWWAFDFLPLARAAGAERYSLIRTTIRDEADIREVITYSVGQLAAPA